MWPSFRLAWVLALPVAGCVVLSIEGWRTSYWIAFLIAIGIFIYDYLQAALIATERARGRHAVEMVRAAIPVLLVGFASGFDWRHWIVEQTLLEAGGFSLAVAICAIAKAWEEGRHAPWLVVGLIFVAPAVGLVWIAGRALLATNDGSLDAWKAILLAAALLVSAWDSWKRISPHVTGAGQLEEPISGGAPLVFVVIWFASLLVGIPWLLGG